MSSEQGELFERDAPEQAPAVRTWHVPAGGVPTIALPGVWRIESTPTGGFVVTEVPDPEASADD